MSAVDPTAEKDLVVVEDGSIPAAQLARFGLRAGVHLRVVEARDFRKLGHLREGADRVVRWIPNP